MYIDKILIDTAEPNLSIADTMRKRDAVIEDLKSYLYRENFDKAFIAHKNPDFVLVVESKVSDIIREGINEGDVLRELVYDLGYFSLAQEAYNKLNNWTNQ